MDNQELHQALERSASNLTYDKCLYQFQLVQNDETTRRLRVKLLLLDGEKDELLAQASEDDFYLRQIESDLDKIKSQARHTKVCLENSQAEIRIKAREVETLKIELSSLHGVMMDSTKLLTEKLALARELSSLRPEIDFLRSQAANNQSVLAENKSLENQLRTLHMQSETEKKPVQHILTGQSKECTEDTDAECQAVALQAHLDHGRREKHRYGREAQQASSTWEAQKLALESRLNLLRSKLATTKETLKETQRDLQAARSAATTTIEPCSNCLHGKIAAPYRKKRTATEMLSQSGLGTPGDVATVKRNQRSSALPGDKSTFSITPYLNRTASLARESPEAIEPSASVAGKNAKEISPMREHIETVAENLLKPSFEKRQEKGPTLAIGRPRKNNARVAQGKEKIRITAKLAKVAEENHDENGQILESRSRIVESSDNDETSQGGEKSRKKKRKLLGGFSKTLFDEDNSEPKPAPMERRFGSLNPGSLAGAKARPLLIASTALNNSKDFGAFSPLKRNSRPTPIRA
ncbi:MAG: hypothetical protein Q9219_007575 [cf. Caloplaca sp. 3 TL-2023]